MKETQYGPCGLFCGACGATDCGGFRSDNIDDYPKQCKFRRCAKERNVDSCCFCGEYPCHELDRFMRDEWPHHWTMGPNLECIRRNGLAEWLRRQKKEWTCSNCSERIYWYQQSCDCGRRLDAWKLPR